MKRRNGIIIVSIMAIAVVVLFQNMIRADQAVTAREVAPRVDHLAPAFSLPGLDGQNYSFDGGQDRAVLINFWASWCKPCRDEAPELIRLHEKYGERLDIYGVNATFFDTMNGVRDFVDEFQIPFPILLDKENTIGRRYEVPGYPMTFLIDRRGVVQDVIIGLIDGKELEAKVRKLVRR